jgi:hypothetical protein
MTKVLASNSGLLQDEKMTTDLSLEDWEPMDCMAFQSCLKAEAYSTVAAAEEMSADHSWVVKRRK